MIDVRRTGDMVAHLMPVVGDRVALCGAGPYVDWAYAVPRGMRTCTTCAAVAERWQRAQEIRDEIEWDREYGL